MAAKLTREQIDALQKDSRSWPLRVLAKRYGVHPNTARYWIEKAA